MIFTIWLLRKHRYFSFTVLQALEFLVVLSLSIQIDRYQMKTIKRLKNNTICDVQYFCQQKVHYEQN